MGHHTLRQDKTCQNCGANVQDRYCGSCGQENTETRQSFHYLFTHFLEDLTHYDSSFWKTLKYLLYAPVTLTKSYLKGQRQRFVAPVKLFIFINFITFLALGLLPDHKNENTKEGISIRISNEKNASEIKELIQKFQPALLKKYTLEEIEEKFIENVKHYFPKTIFLYMPLFAFVLWLFHSKKKWWYFDHGIYTFHLFSSMMLLILVFNILDYFLGLIHWDSISDYFTAIFFLYFNYLYIHSHRKMYGEKRLVAHSKAFVMFILNGIIISFLAVLLVLFSFYSLH